ncbi:MAG: META domain-containing protein [Alphaproteobacteria bacterium]
MKRILTTTVLAIGLCACTAPQTIRGNEYKLTNAPNKADITLAFSDTDNRYFGHAVNRYFGQYIIEGNHLTFGLTGSTMMMGPVELMEAEQAYFKQLSETVSYHTDGSVLTLQTADGKTLVFEKIGVVKEKGQK